MSPEVKTNLDIICAQIDKTYGKGTIMSLSDKPTINTDSIISTGSIALDGALGIGGYPKGRIVEVYGPESAGKTTLALHAIAEVQKQGLKAVIIDAEHSLDPLYAASLGVDVNSLLISQPDFGEQALDVALLLAKSGEVGLIVVDSVAALIPKAELEGEITDHAIGSQARLMSKAMRMLVGSLNNTKCTIMFINQIRMKIGGYGNPEVTSGGGALKFYASQRIEIRGGKKIQEGEKVIAREANVKVVKNKLAPPFRKANFEIKFGIGINQTKELLHLAIEDDIIKKAGSWFKYNDESIAQGEQNAEHWLKENPEELEIIKQQILELRGLENVKTTEDSKGASVSAS